MTKGFVVPAGGGKHYEEAPGRFFDLKLLADQTGQSIMLFEETGRPAPGARITCTTTATRSSGCWRASSPSRSAIR